MEYELVSMIQISIVNYIISFIERVASSLSSLHRYIYYDLPTISEEQEQFMINQLQQEEGENAIITALYVSQVHTHNNIPDFCHKKGLQSPRVQFRYDRNLFLYLAAPSAILTH